MRSLILQNNKLVKVAAITTLFAMLLWTVGLQSAKGAGITSFSDTLSDSAPSAIASHTFAFTTANAITDDSAGADEFIELTFSANWVDVATITDADITGESGLTVVNACGGGTDEVTVTSTATTIRLTVCAGDTVPAGAISFTVGDGTGTLNNITNPSAGSEEIDLETSVNGSTVDSGSTRVFIIDNISMTATVDTIFNFWINGRTTADNTANGEGGTNDIETTATTIPWGEITSGSPYLASHTLSVATNATNGFVVTLEQDANMTSSASDDIDLFIDGAATATPVAWAAPTGTLAFGENGYGHYGITSEDSDLNGDEFGVALYAGNIGSPRQVFDNDGPADGESNGSGTADVGATVVGYKIELSGLQEAGDYQNTLTYIATPTF